MHLLELRILFVSSTANKAHLSPATLLLPLKISTLNHWRTTFGLRYLHYRITSRGNGGCFRKTGEVLVVLSLSMFCFFLYVLLGLVHIISISSCAIYFKLSTVHIYSYLFKFILRRNQPSLKGSLCKHMSCESAGMQPSPRSART